VGNGPSRCKRVYGVGIGDNRVPEQMLHLAETTMPDPYLPAEMLDHIIDHLHDTPDALRNCSLVSKSWIPRTRRHLFADISFPTTRSVRSWKKSFPDPANSPARYAKTLYFGSDVVAAADAEVGGWIRGFSSVVRLALFIRRSFSSGSSSLVPFHGFSPAMKSLRMVLVIFPSSQIFNLILSFPLLEDIAVSPPYRAWLDRGNGPDWPPTVAHPSSPPMLTGSLELYPDGAIDASVSLLLSLPGGIHFRKLTLTWLRMGDLSLTMALVDECSHTLESLDITCTLLGQSDPRPRLHRQLTSVPSWVGASFDRPFESDKTQRCGISTQVVEC
jgi:hypothetical protein